MEKNESLQSEHLQEVASILADQIIQSIPRPYELLPPAAAKAKVQFEIEAQLQHIPEKIERGVMQLFNKLQLLALEKPEIIDEHILQDITKLRNLPNEHEVKEGIAQGKTLKEIFGIQHESLQAAYTAAVEIYNQQLYQDAADIYFVLTLLDPSQYLFWLGLGNAEFYSKHYDEALTAYALAVYANPVDPRCHLYAAHCYAEIGKVDLAMNSLEIALHVIEENPKFIGFREVTEARLKMLKQTINK